MMTLGADAAKPHETYAVAPALPEDVERHYADISVGVVQGLGALHSWLREHQQCDWSELRGQLPDSVSSASAHVLDTLARNHDLDVRGLVGVVQGLVARAGLDVARCRPLSESLADARAAATDRVAHLLQDLDPSGLAKLKELSHAAVTSGLDYALDDTGVGGEVGQPYQLLLGQAGPGPGMLRVVDDALSRELQRRRWFTP